MSVLNYGLEQEIEVFVQKGYISESEGVTSYNAPESFDIGDFCTDHDDFNGVDLFVDGWAYDSGLLPMSRHGELRSVADRIFRLHGLLSNESNTIELFQTARVTDGI